MGGALSPCGVIKLNGTYFLYYVAGSFSGYNGDARNRSLGVATSSDGINYTKYSGNPIINAEFYGETFGETGEAGAGSCAPHVENGGNVVLHYGAMTEFSTGQVFIDDRLAVSTNGQDFTDVGVVIDHGDSSFWGTGDEIGPLATAVLDDGTTVLYYLCLDGNGCRWSLGVATGPNQGQMTTSQEVINESTAVRDLGLIRMGGDSAALFITKDSSNWRVEVRMVDLKDPASLSDPVATYDFNRDGLGAPHNNQAFPGIEFSHNVFFLDKELGRWFVYYHLGDPQNPDIAVMTVDVGGGDTTSPSQPQGLAASDITESTVGLSWQTAADDESGISRYLVFRDGAQTGQTGSTGFIDTGLTENRQYVYTVAAVNGAGIEGTMSAPLTVNSLIDSTPPTITSVSASGEQDRLTVVFSETLDKDSAETVANYGLDNGAAVISAVLGPDIMTVTLTTSELSEGVSYTLSVSSVRDASSGANAVAAGTSAEFTLVSTLAITGLSPAGYEVRRLEADAQIFTDRPLTFANVPSILEGAAYIMTANDDKLATSNPMVRFNVNQAVTVFVAHDDRLPPKPAWLEFFSDTGVNVVIFESTHSIFGKEFPVGVVELGPNQGISNSSMYSVMVKGPGAFDPSPPMLTIPPTVDAGPNVTINMGQTFKPVVSITDENDSSWQVKVDYGDGTGEEALVDSSNALSLEHVYVEPGEFTASITVTDSGGGSGVDEVVVTVLAVYPTLPGMAAPAQDIDGDGKAEDVNGNGRPDFMDIVVLFQFLEHPDVQTSAFAFDFNGNGVIDMADVTRLFDDILSMGGG